MRLSTESSASLSGGAIELISGLGAAPSSGDVSIETADFGVAGASGQLELTTGAASSGASGEIKL